MDTQPKRVMSKDRQLALGDFGRGATSESGDRSGVDIAGWPAEETGHAIPCKLLRDLRSDSDPGSRAELCSPVAGYLTTHQHSGHARDAAAALKLLLKDASPPVDCPGLLRLLEYPHLDREILLDHLLNISR